MKLQAIETKARSNFDTMIIGMNAARKGISTPQQNAATLAIAQEFQANALARADFDLYSSFTELFNSIFEEKEQTTIVQADPVIQVAPIEVKTEKSFTHRTRGERLSDYLSFSDPTSASTRLVEYLMQEAKSLEDVAYRLDIERLAREYGVKPNTITVYLTHFNKQRYVNINREGDVFHLLPNTDDMRHYKEGQLPPEKSPSRYEGLTVKESIDTYLEDNFTKVYKRTSYDDIARAVRTASTGTVRNRVGALVASGKYQRRIAEGHTGYIQLRKAP